MKRRQRQALGAAGVVGLLAVLVPLAIQLDGWYIERKRLIARQAFEEAVAECEAAGGKWWRGDCLPEPP